MVERFCVFRSIRLGACEFPNCTTLRHSVNRCIEYSWIAVLFGLEFRCEATSFASSHLFCLQPPLLSSYRNESTIVIRGVK